VNEPTNVEPIVARLGADSGVIFNPDAFMTNNHIAGTRGSTKRYLNMERLRQRNAMIA
jgi:hypothetical protein